MGRISGLFPLALAVGFGVLNGYIAFQPEVQKLADEKHNQSLRPDGSNPTQPTQSDRKNPENNNNNNGKWWEFQFSGWKHPDAGPPVTNAITKQNPEQQQQQQEPVVEKKDS
ncbi:hypothetical protein AJ80_02467 [Polytolypa hystricis UAMH7299]|uniref:Uncharacterized protein n=1 Tax=Polytolypa hystricis (strain UAMH7299) TaxID=1447883 RepID=A0A2B7YR95_POLH7|nr:hypothetical protein AJ80_02467 [Polytolypa hystricis UAMH7299]